MSENEPDKVVVFRKPGAAPTASAAVPVDFVGPTKRVVALAMADALTFERERLKVAKEIGCRVSFLGRIRESVWEEVNRFKYDWRLHKFDLERAGQSIKYHDDGGSTVEAIIMARACYKEGEYSVVWLIMKADGNFSIVRAVPSGE
jgi:hypothetical protein